MINLELKIPPPILGLFCAVLVWVFSRLWPTLSFDFVGQKLFAVLLVMIGLTIDILALLKFKNQKTTINPMNPDKSSDLVTTGIYNFTRNPMYLGLLIMLSAWALYLGNLISIIILIIFVFYITKFQILPEEVVMHEKFGELFLEYKKNVRQWI